MKEKQDGAESKIQNRAVFKLVEYVKIFVPGEKNLRPDRPVTENDKRRWPTAYAQFQRTKEETVEGTPVEQWPYLNRAQVAEMKANGFLTVEAIAECPDGMLTKMGLNGRDIQKRARQFLKPQSDTETELRSEIEQLSSSVKDKDMQIDHMTKRLEAMEQQLTALSAQDSEVEPEAEETPRRRTRTRKTAA